MKFYFCETCGKRLTEKDLEEGLGRNKKLKGVYCNDCAVGVMTMETLPLTEGQAREILNKPSSAGHTAGKRRHSAFGLQPPGRETQNLDRTRHHPANSSGSMPNRAQIVLVGVAALVLATIAVKFRENRIVPEKDTTAEPTAKSIPAEPRSSDAARVAPLVPAPVVPVVQTPSLPSTDSAVHPAGPPSSEQAAKDEFETLVQFAGLDSNDRAGQIARLEDFVSRHGDTIIAARARRQLEVLKGSDKSHSTVPTVVEPAATWGPNLAQARNGATATGGANPELLIDGNSTDFSESHGFAWTHWATRTPYIIIPKESPTLNAVRFRLWDRDVRAFRYLLEASSDLSGNTWKVLADRTKETETCRGWQTIEFPAQKIRRFRLVGTHCDSANGFRVVEFEAYSRVEPAPALPSGPAAP